MITSRRLALLALTFGAALVARADETPALRAPLHSLSPILAVLDADQNGALSASEIATAPLALAALDLDEDGKISVGEQRAADAGGAGRSRRSGVSFNLVFALDANHDGDIQPMEIANAVSSLKRLDANHDGEIARSELRPVMIARS